MLFDIKELKARIEHTKRNLEFYSRYYELLEKELGKAKLEKLIDNLLDKLLELLKELKD